MPQHASPLLTEREEGAWFGFLSTHLRLTRELDARLVEQHRMPLVEYEVLLKLAIAGGRLRMSELADAALLSRSGLTRIVDALESLGLVTREPDDHDGRVLRATMTRAGRAAFRAARNSHLANVHELFLDRITETERAALERIWDKVQNGLPAQVERRPRASAARGRSSLALRPDR